MGCRFSASKASVLEPRSVLVLQKKLDPGHLFFPLKPVPTAPVLGYLFGDLQKGPARV
jgi:hypothetical protein